MPASIIICVLPNTNADSTTSPAGCSYSSPVRMSV